MSVLKARVIKKGSVWIKPYHISILQTRENKKRYHQCILFGQERIKYCSYKCQYDQSKGWNEETKDEEPSVTDNSVINISSYFELFECSKNFLNNLDATYERACMANPKKKWDTAKSRYGRARML